MPNDNPRSHRVADFIQRELSGIIRGQLKDPRLSPMLTIASVDVSRDLSVAKVYYSLFDSDEQRDTQAALVSAAGFLRKQLARQMNTRSVPQLRFFYDDSAERGAHMSALIADAVASNTTEDDNAANDTPDNNNNNNNNNNDSPSSRDSAGSAGSANSHDSAGLANSRDESEQGGQT